MLKISRRLSFSLLLVFNLVCFAEPAETGKFLVGNIEGDHYIAHNRHFSFKLPISGKSQVLKKSLADAVTDSADIITINSAEESASYRFEISRVLPGDKDNKNFSTATAKTFSWYRRLIERAWRSPVTEIVNKEFSLNGQQAAHAIFKKFADAESGPRYHIFYLADYGNHISFLWTHISLPEESLETEDTIIAASDGPALKARQSFFSFRLE